MKITYYTPFYLPQSTAAAIRGCWLIRTLKDAGHELSVLSSQQLIFNQASNRSSFLKRLIFEVFSGVELFFRIIFQNSDMVVLSSPPFITVLIAHFACRLKNVRYVIDVRDIYPDVYFAQGLVKEESLPGKLIKALTRGMYEGASGVTTVTPGLVNKIQTLAPAVKQLELLINGFDRELFTPSKKKYEKFTVIFHGNMGKIQDLQTILDVAQKLKEQTDIEFVFIGEGPQSELLTKCQLSNVRYLGPKDYNEIPKLISEAHVGFSARRDDEVGADAFPVKVFEYIGVGIPVIMTPKTGVMTGMVESGLYEFENKEIKEMAQKILDLKKLSPEISVPDRFSRQEESKKILKLCRSTK